MGLRLFSNAMFERPAVLSLFRMAGAGFGFLAHLMLAWILTPAQLGVFFAASSLVTVATLVTTQGYPQIAARFAARYSARAKSRWLPRFVGRALSDGVRFACAAAALIVAVVWCVPGVETTTRWTFSICAAIVVAATITSIEAHLAGALKRFSLCYVPDGFFRPILCFLALCMLMIAGAHPNDAEVALLFAVITFGVAAFIHVALKPALPQWTVPPLRADPVARRWRREARPLIVLSLFTNHFGDLAILCVTPFMAAAEIAVFGLCVKMAMLVGFIVQVTQQVAVPDLAASLRDRDSGGVDRAVWRSILGPTAATLAAVGGVALLGRPVLALFGPSFVAGYAALLILIFGQAMRAMAGPGAHVITLKGAQDINAALSGGAIGVLLLADAALVPAFGMAGGAFAVFLTLTLWLAATAVSLRRLGERRVDILAVLMTPPARPAGAR